MGCRPIINESYYFEKSLVDGFALAKRSLDHSNNKKIVAVEPNSHLKVKIINGADKQEDSNDG